ncbi:hypothetical protein [Flavobacterium sp.]|uniref:hypothetical protein n=1 Tax=Flavobacterium sp. TaxID=239 RepID=UPI0008D16096|nr:hypothetical protein [Flavobacterium sp.]OGS61985.1 MAG: hypothetical protein A2X07_09030 [Flavobacteria bacterium GWF1_32_7]HBD27133.1 hypothetical protein [Flavobacterium sp.]
MKNIIIAIAFFFLSYTNAQDKKIYALEFYSWVGANDNISYEMASIIFDSNLDSNDYYCNNKEYNALIRVKYSEKGVEKIFDYNAYVNILYLDNQTEIQNKNGAFYTMIIDGYAPAKLIKGNGSYNPDNFVVSGIVTKNTPRILNAYHLDDAEFLQQNIKNASVKPEYINTTDEGRAKIKKFFSSTDEMYRLLMLYIANFD